MKIDIAKHFLEGVGISTDLSNLTTNDCILAVDIKHLTNYDIAKLINSESRYIHGRDMLESLYTNIIAKWLIGDYTLANTQWGICFNVDTVCLTPVRVVKPFAKTGKLQYHFGALGTTPDVFVLLLKDSTYTKVVYTVWKQLRENYDTLMLEGNIKFSKELIVYTECCTYIKNRLDDLNIIFLESFIRTPEFMDFMHKEDEEIYSKLLVSNIKDVVQFLGPTAIIRYLDKYFKLDYTNEVVNNEYV